MSCDVPPPQKKDQSSRHCKSSTQNNRRLHPGASWYRDTNHSVSTLSPGCTCLTTFLAKNPCICDYMLVFCFCSGCSGRAPSCGVVIAVCVGEMCWCYCWYWCCYVLFLLLLLLVAVAVAVDVAFVLVLVLVLLLVVVFKFVAVVAVVVVAAAVLVVGSFSISMMLRLLLL